MNKKILVFICIFLLGGGSFFLVHRQEEENKAGRIAREERAAETASPGNQPKTLRIDGLNISQGEAGNLQWTLIAETADMRLDGIIHANNPFLTYFMRNESAAGEKAGRAEAASSPQPAKSTVTVAALSGEIDQQADIMSFKDKVVMVSGEKTLLTDSLEYSGKEKKLSSNVKTLFFGETMRGQAGKAFLSLRDNILYASGGVSVNMVMASKGGGPGALEQPAARREN